MTHQQPNSEEDDVWIEQLVLADEMLTTTEDTHGEDSTQVSSVSPDGQVTDCLRLLKRVRQQSPKWPGRSDGWQWLYSEELTPRQIGRFEIRRRLGMGGFGIVFLAHDPRLDREVALKVPTLQSMVSAESRRRFLRESKLTASLAHQNIAAVFEAGIMEPVAFIATAFYPGGSIQELIQRENGPLAPKTAARVTMVLAQAVQHAHSRGVLHRDIKPSNVLLDVPPEHLATVIADPVRLAHAVRLTDFGLGRQLASGEDGTVVAADRTRTGAMLGTPAYMAPEQIDGQRDAITASADIYALGATLFCLLVGQPPFRRPSDWETLQAVQKEEALAPSRERTGISRDLDAICLKCLEKDPRNRYQTASELEHDLGRFLNGEPVLARHIGGLGRGARWCRRNPLLSSALLALILILTSATAVSSVFWLRADRARRQSSRHELAAKQRAQEALTQTQRVRQAVDELLTAIAEEPSLRSEGMEPFRQKLLAAAKNFYDHIRGDDPNNLDIVSENLETTMRLATIHRLLGDHTQALQLWKDAAAECRRSFPDDPSRLAKILGSQAAEFEALGEQELAVDLSMEALRLQQRATEQQPSVESQTKLVQVLTHNAQTLNSRGSHEKANQLLDEAIALIEQITGQPLEEWTPCKLWGIVLRDKARTLSLLGHYDASDQFAQVAMHCIETCLEQTPSERSACFMHLAALRRTLGHNREQTGDVAAALNEYQMARDLAVQLVEQHPHVGMLHDYLAEQVNTLGRVMMAEGTVQEARQMVLENQHRIEEGRRRFPDLEAQWEQRSKELEHIRNALPATSSPF